MKHSFDCFDTLIGRKCGQAGHLFANMGRILKNPKFPDQRRAAERYYQNDHSPYSLLDIYRRYVDVYGGNAEELADIEWNLELENTYAIKRVAGWLKDRDVIVSDMYLSEDQIRQLLEKAGIQFSGQVVVSNYGKMDGTVWGDIKRDLIGHYGDNPVTDQQSAQRAGIHFTNARTDPTRHEKNIMAHSETLGWFVRYLRLNRLTEDPVEKLALLQISINLPLLRAACDPLHEWVQARKIKKLLFMSRDGQLFHKIWQHLHPEVESEYIYISRDALRFGSDLYFEYLNEKYKKGTCLVDLAASFGSLKVALPRIKHDNPMIWSLVFLPDFGVDTSGLTTSYVHTNYTAGINNTWLEMLNYATHRHVIDIRKEGKTWLPVTDLEEEYEMQTVAYMQDAFMDAMPEVPSNALTRSPKALIKTLLEAFNEQGTFLRRTFPMHLVLERARKVRMQQIGE